MQRAFLALSLTACGTGGAVALTCPATDWVPVGIDADSTALEAWEGGKAIADATLGAEAKWLGGMTGVAIARDGTPSEALVTGWAFTFCSGMDQVGFSVGPPESGGQCGVDVINCDASPAFTLFADDSPDVITTAFPDDGSDATYALSLTLGLASTWTVTNLATSVSVKVDAVTGEVVP